MEGGLADMTGLSSDNSGNNLETRRATAVAGGFDFMEDRPVRVSSKGRYITRNNERPVRLSSKGVLVQIA